MRMRMQWRIQDFLFIIWHNSCRKLHENEKMELGSVPRAPWIRHRNVCIWILRRIVLSIFTDCRGQHERRHHIVNAPGSSGSANTTGRSGEWSTDRGSIGWTKSGSRIFTCARICYGFQRRRSRTKVSWRKWGKISARKWCEWKQSLSSILFQIGTIKKLRGMQQIYLRIIASAWFLKLPSMIKE